MTSVVLIQLTVPGLHMLSALQVGPMNIIQVGNLIYQLIRREEWTDSNGRRTSQHKSSWI